MKERIRELSEGRVEYRKPRFTVTPEIIDIELDTDGLQRMVVMVESTSNLQVKGVAYSSHSRVRVVNPTFFGKVNAINLEINTMGLKGGSKLAGVITLVTNAGERDIKFTYTMHEANYGVDERTINTLDDFADFVREDEEGALRCFRSRAFMDMPFMQDMNTQAIYQVLMNEKDGRANLEAFLNYHDVKSPVTFVLVKSEDTIEEPEEPVRRTVELKKDTWGYGVVSISCDCPLVALGCDKITTDDFDEEGICRVGYTLFPGVSKNENSNMEIVFHTSKKELIYTLEVTAGPELIKNTKGNPEKRENLKLMDLIVEYRIAQIKSGDKNTSKVKKSLGNLIDYLEESVKASPENWERKLILVYLYMKNDRIEDADKYLDEVREEVMRNRLVHVRAYCFFLYLRAMFYDSAEQKDTASKLISKYYTENGQDPALMLLLLKTDVTYTENPSLKLLKLKEQYNAGCTSPLLYLEACESYRKSPDLLRVMNDFERQAMFFGARKNLLTEDLAVEVARLCGYEDKYRPATYHLLENMFECYPIQIVLDNLCGYLIRTNRKGEKYFKWYELGIRGGVSILGINESYLASLPEKWNKPLPKEILLYFAYSQNLGGEIREQLYENILNYIDQDSQIYNEYKDQMEEYAFRQLLEGRFSRKLLPLYKQLLSGRMIDERLAKVLPELLMTYEITCNRKDMRKLVIRCPELKYEDSYTLTGGACCAPLYTDDCMIFFVDGYGNRYSDIAFEKSLLFEDETLLERCEKRYTDYLIFMLRKAKKNISQPVKDEDELRLISLILSSADVSDFFKLRLISKLLNYAIIQKKSVSDDILLSLDFKNLSDLDRRKALVCMVNNRHYTEVYEYIYKNGASGLGTETLLLLAENRIQRVKGEEENFLVYLSKFLFDKGCTSVQLNAYLCSYYSGPCEEMRKVLFACGETPVILGDLPEKTIGQMLFTDDMTDIDKVFDIYIKGQKVNKQIVRAYEVYCCYHYFVNNSMIDVRVFQLLDHQMFGENANELLKKELENNDIINIGLLLYLTKTPDVRIDQLQTCELLLKRLCQKGIMLGFYSMLWTKVSFPAELNGKVLLEHRSKSAVRAYCTYRRLDSEETTTILMQKMYEGVFVAQLVLFADETLEYTITEEIDGEIKTAVNKELLSNDMTFVRNGSSFETINDFSRLYASGKENELENALVEYEEKQHVISSLFGPL